MSSEAPAPAADVAGAPVTDLEPVVQEPDPQEVSALPPQFFEPLESFDAVRHLLENLPEDEGLSPGFLSAQTAQTQTVLDAINSQLSARVMRSYGAFVHGMAQVQQLESDLVLTAILCRSARRHLGTVQGGMVHGGLRLLNRLRRRHVMAALAKTLTRLAELSSGLPALERLIRPGWVVADAAASRPGGAAAEGVRRASPTSTASPSPSPSPRASSRPRSGCGAASSRRCSTPAPTLSRAGTTRH